jgi:hypothetical protein
MSGLDADINPCVCEPLRKFHLGEHPAIWRRTISGRRLQLRTRLRCYRRHRPSLRLFPRDASGYRLRGISSSASYQTSFWGTVLRTIGYIATALVCSSLIHHVDHAWSFALRVGLVTGIVTAVGMTVNPFIEC